MEHSAWILAMIPAAVAIFGGIFALLIKLKKGEISKKQVFQSLVIASVISVSIYILGNNFLVKLPVETQKNIDQPPFIELSVEYPHPAEFPQDDKPLVQPVTTLWLWTNSGGPINHCEIQMIDVIEITSGPCGDLAHFKSRLIPIQSRNKGSSLLIDRPESSFFISNKDNRFLSIYNKAIFGLEFNEENSTDNILKPYSEAFERFIATKRGLCGFLRKLKTLIKFVYLDLNNNKRCLFYRIGSTFPYDTVLEEEWTNTLKQIPEKNRADGYYIEDLSDPKKIYQFLNGKSLVYPK